MPGHVIAMSWGGFLGGDRDSPLDALLLELAPSARPRLVFLPTAIGDSPQTIEAFHDAFAHRGLELDVVRLFGAPDRVGCERATARGYRVTADGSVPLETRPLR